MTTVDVVIPARHGVGFLPEALDSVIAQTGCDLRIWIVDDGAGTDLAALVPPAAAGVTRILANRFRPGIGGARNTGVAQGRADYVAFLDCDDLWPAGRTEALLRAIQGSVPDEGADPGGADHGGADHGGAGERGAGHGGADIAFGMATQFAHGDASRFRVPNVPQRGSAAGGLLMRRSVWDTVGSFDDTLVLGEFVDWVARLRRAGIREALIDDVVLHRRIHGDNTTLRRLDQRQDYVDIVRRHLRAMAP